MQQGLIEVKTKFVNVYIHSTFGGEVVIKGEIVGEKTHGFHYDNTPYSAWCLYGHGGCIPAVFILLREYKHRKISIIGKNRIIKIEEI